MKFIVLFVLILPASVFSQDVEATIPRRVFVRSQGETAQEWTRVISDLAATRFNIILVNSEEEAHTALVIQEGTPQTLAILNTHGNIDPVIIPWPAEGQSLSQQAEQIILLLEPYLTPVAPEYREIELGLNETTRQRLFTASRFLEWRKGQEFILDVSASNLTYNASGNFALSTDYVPVFFSLTWLNPLKDAKLGVRLAYFETTYPSQFVNGLIPIIDQISVREPSVEMATAYRFGHDPAIDFQGGLGIGYSFIQSKDGQYSAQTFTIPFNATLRVLWEASFPLFWGVGLEIRSSVFKFLLFGVTDMTPEKFVNVRFPVIYLGYKQ